MTRPVKGVTPHGNGLPTRVLVVGAQPDDRSLLKRLLIAKGKLDYALHWVLDQEAGFDALSSGAHDVVLVAHQADAMDGLEFVRLANAHACRRPIILLMGEVDDAAHRGAVEAGAADCVAKRKLDSAALQRSIQRALLHARQRDELECRLHERTAAFEAESHARQRADAELRQVDRRREAFLATLAHELRNPLAPMRNALEIMRLAADKPETVDRARGMLDRQMHHLIRLVDDLLDVSRITRNRVPLLWETVPLKAIVERALDGAHSFLDAGQHRFLLDLPEPTVYVRADPTRLAQVFLNLLNNAAKFTAPGGQITLSARVLDAEVEVSISDTGIGIPPELLENVFELFAQVNPPPDRVQSGLGIGLSIVKSLVEMHNGRVSAHSDGPGKGSTFRVFVPIVTQPA